MGENLRQARKRAGFTLAEVAERMGVRLQSVQRWESGERKPDPAKVRQLADLYGVSADELLGRGPARGTEPLRTIPVVGAVRAGLPVLAEENVIGYIETTDKEADFALRVRGDSMEQAGIMDGDIAICRQVESWEQVRSGSIVVATLNGGEATLKRLVRRDGSWFLHAESKEPGRYPDIVCGEDTEVRAVVLRIQRELEGGHLAEPEVGRVAARDEDDRARLIAMLEEAIAVSRIQAEANRSQAAANERTAAAAERAAAAAERIAAMFDRRKDGREALASPSEEG